MKKALILIVIILYDMLIILPLTIVSRVILRILIKLTILDGKLRGLL